MNTISIAQSISIYPSVIYSGDIIVSLGANSPSPIAFKKPSIKVSTAATLKFIEAPAGIGKTKALAIAIRTLKARGERCLVVLPQRDLIASYQARNPDWHYVYTGSDTERKSVTQVAIDALKEYKPVIVITQECLERLARLIDVDEELTQVLEFYNVYLDEVPAAKNAVGQYIEHGKEHLGADFLPYLIEVEKNIYETTRNDIAQDQACGPKYSAAFKTFAHHLAVGGQVQKVTKSTGTLWAGMADKASFRLLGTAKTVMLMGAAVERMSFVTRAQELFGKGNLNIVEDKTLIPAVKPYANPERCTFHPMVKGKASFANTKDNFKEICERALKAIPKGEPFLYVSNHNQTSCPYSDIADAVLGAAGGVRLPFNSHGLNDFAGVGVHGGTVTMITTDPKDEGKTLVTEQQMKEGFHHCIYLGMSNLSPAERQWLSEDLQDALTLERGPEVGFQALTRTTLRNFNDESTKHVFVVIDETYAEYATSKWLKGAVIVEGESVLPRTGKRAEMAARDASFLDAVKTLTEAGKKLTPRAIVELTGMNPVAVKNQLQKYRKEQAELDLVIGTV